MLSRQVLCHREQKKHVLPGNAFLPAHESIIITRGLQEWACLLPQDLPFASAARLLGWQTQEEALLCDTTLRTLVRQHGQLIRQVENAQVEALLLCPHLEEVAPFLVSAKEPRRRAGWPAEMCAAVDAALIAGEARPPEGVSLADWERVLLARQQEASLSAQQLRHLGPQLEAGQVLATCDEVLTRAQEPSKLGTKVRHKFWELRTARVVTAEGTRYLSGVGESFLRLLLVMLFLCCGHGKQDRAAHRSLLLLADGARWIRTFFNTLQQKLPDSRMFLDWFHLKKKCSELCSMICRGRKAKGKLLHHVLGSLWQGQVAGAIEALEAYRPEAKNLAKLEELIGYLREREPYIPNYRQRRRERHYIGSGHVEKANDLLVAQRQKGKGMHWSLETSDSLAALRTLMLNGGWDRYWRGREHLPLVAA